MKIRNPRKATDAITVEASDHHEGLVRLNIGVKGHNPRHSNLRPETARAVAKALLFYAEQVSH